jgi:hypothetical protein
MKLLLPIFSFFLAFSNIASSQMSATLNIQDQQYLSESYKVEGEFIPYASSTILLFTNESYDAELAFQFSYQEKIINQANFEDHQLELAFSYNQELFTIIPDYTADKLLKLSFIIEDVETLTELDILLKNEKEEIVAKYNFSLEFAQEVYIQSSSAVNNLEDRRVIFTATPLVLNIKTIDGSFYYQVDSTTIIIPIEKQSHGFKVAMIIDFLNIKERYLFEDLDITIEWIGKGLVLEDINDSEYHFLIKPLENPNQNSKWSTYISDTDEISEYIYSSRMTPSPKSSDFDQTIIEGIYSMQISLANKATKQMITKKIDFYILK